MRTSDGKELKKKREKYEVRHLVIIIDQRELKKKRDRLWRELPIERNQQKRNTRKVQKRFLKPKGKIGVSTTVFHVSFTCLPIGPMGPSGPGGPPASPLGPIGPGNPSVPIIKK